MTAAPRKPSQVLHTDKLGLDRERREIPDDGVKLNADLRRIGDVGDHEASEASAL